ncbi:MAG: hypothetical protein HKM05_12255 [Spirochaetales bacterium]|nr:hypothetical protein [Spirochaetales bacterium]
MKQHFEIIFQTLYDVGRAVQVEAVAQRFPAARPLSFQKWRDTPESLLLPLPLIVPLESGDLELPEGWSSVILQAKVYEEGVITLECRLNITGELTELHRIRHTPLSQKGRELTTDQLIHAQFRQFRDQIDDLIALDPEASDKIEREQYRLFCLVDPVRDPAGFVEEHQAYLAPFLLGEDPDDVLHASQVNLTLKTPFSFHEDDLAIFDLDRAFLINPRRDYEDLVLILEHANYQLLELRVLDKLLDSWLDEASRVLRRTGKNRARFELNPLRSLSRLSQKIGRLQGLRLDALFLLENLENSSRIIGDYYLEQVYDHLCLMFNTQGWKRNIERRLELLENIYTMTKSDSSERTMVLLELIVVLMIGLEIVALFFPPH